MVMDGWNKTSFDEDDLSAQPGQVAKMSSVYSVECVIVHLEEETQGLTYCRKVSRDFWLEEGSPRL